MNAARLLHGDCVEVMAAMPDESVDVVVTDPPYGLEFMGKEWDSFRIDERNARWTGENSGGAGAGFGEIEGGSSLPSFGKRRTTGLCRRCGKRDAFRNPHACGDAADWVTIPVDNTPMEMRAFQNWCALWAVEALRVLKPGGHLLAFGGTRTYHRMACALEEAGFEIRDSLHWIYGSGFPKSLDVSKAVDKKLGAEREVIGERAVLPGLAFESTGPSTVPVTAPATAAAAAAAGWGTALKPAHEPVVLARKLLNGTVAENFMEHGTGALNIDAARVGVQGGTRQVVAKDGPTGEEVTSYGASLGSAPGGNEDAGGRWPSNVVLAHLEECKGSGPRHTEVLCAPGCPVAELNAMSGETESTRQVQTSKPGKVYGAGAGLPSHTGEYGYDDAGGAARFFYIAKPKTRERIGGTLRNLHPTVKPVELMRYLVRLVTPPGGVVLDPFMGSGTTGCACAAEDVDFIGIEQDADSYETAAARVADWCFAHGRPRPLAS